MPDSTDKIRTFVELIEQARNSLALDEDQIPKFQDLVDRLTAQVNSTPLEMRVVALAAMEILVQTMLALDTSDVTAFAYFNAAIGIGGDALRDAMSKSLAGMEPRGHA